METAYKEKLQIVGSDKFEILEILNFLIVDNEIDVINSLGKTSILNIIIVDFF